MEDALDFSDVATNQTDGRKMTKLSLNDEELEAKVKLKKNVLLFRLGPKNKLSLLKTPLKLWLARSN